MSNNSIRPFPIGTAIIATLIGISIGITIGRIFPIEQAHSTSAARAVGASSKSKAIMPVVACAIDSQAPCSSSFAIVCALRTAASAGPSWPADDKQAASSHAA